MVVCCWCNQPIKKRPALFGQWLHVAGNPYCKKDGLSKKPEPLVVSGDIEW